MGKYALAASGPEDTANVMAGYEWFKAQEFNDLKETRDGHRMRFKATERPWRAEFLPQKLQLTKARKLPDFVDAFPGAKTTYSCGFLVNPELKALIESHETPEDGWQFFPVEILNKDSSEYGI